jgi:hypothetical protein
MISRASRPIVRAYDFRRAGRDNSSKRHRSPRVETVDGRVNGGHDTRPSVFGRAMLSSKLKSQNSTAIDFNIVAEFQYLNNSIRRDL